MNKKSTKTFSILIVLLLLTSAMLHAQEMNVTLKVMNAKREPVSFASITLVNRTDSNLTRHKAADSTGLAYFKLAKGPWTIRISSVNYQPFEKTVTVNPNQVFFNCTLESTGKTMGEVVVTGQKPLMRQEDDKTIVDPENLAAMSTSGYEVIEKTPGLFVDQDGNIYISSLTPAAVQINGQDLKMSAGDMATLLKSLPPASISRIEIVRTPSAKYDASSSGGIVNVVLKKGFKIGLTGSVNTGLQQGRYGNQFAGFNLNNNDGRKNTFLNLNYNRRNNYDNIITDRVFAPDSMLSQDAFTKYPAAVYFAGFGFAFPASPKWDIDFSSSISYNDYNNRSENHSTIKKISTSQVLTDNLSKTKNDGNALAFRSGITGKLKIDSLGSEWSNDIFYNFTHNKSQQDFSTEYFSPFSTTTHGDGQSDNKRNHINFQSDLKLKLKQKVTLETGLRASFLEYRSVTNYFKESGGIRVKDDGRTNTFHYNENINAAYLQGSKTFGKDAVLKLGVRLENTNMDGNQVIPRDTSFTIHRTDLFPYVYLSKTIMKIAGYDLRAYLIYRRTISRPGYDQLNPFPRYVDQYLTEAGNPALRPQFTRNYEANISVDERPLLAVGVNDTKDIFTNVIYQADSSNSQAYRTYDNLGHNKEWYFRALGAVPPGKKYFFVIVAQYNHNFYSGLYENKPLSFKKGTWTFYTYHNLKLDKRSQFTLNGFLRLKGQQQFYELSTFGALNASINRQFFNQKLIVTMSVNDIFKSNKNEFTIKQGSVDATGFRSGDTRRFGINLRYNFGIRKKEETNMFNVDTEKTN